LRRPISAGSGSTFNSLSRDHPRSRRSRLLVSFFQLSLGITVSELVAAKRKLIEQSFQLPLSGSPARMAAGREDEELSTPSLGITSIQIREMESKFDWVVLSTPSLGITEPDFGIFRLSAAFCRGTSSHKRFLRPLFGYIVSPLYKGFIRQISLYFCHLVHLVSSAKFEVQKLRKPQLLNMVPSADGFLGQNNPLTRVQAGTCKRR
jgi:hypothetical protein